jgi:methyl-accepting chemotaxis protein
MNVFNFDWSRFPLNRDIEKAAKQVTGSIDKVDRNVGKLANDMKRNTDRITASIKGGTKKIADSVKATNNEESNQNVPTIAESIRGSLKGIAASTSQIADRIQNPMEIAAALESAKAVSEHFSELVDRSAKYADECRRLRETTKEVNKAAGWIGSSFPSGGGGVAVNNSFGNSFGRVVGSFAEL